MELYSYEIALLPVYILFICMAAFVCKELRYPNQPFNRFFVPGILVKLIGTILYCSIYQFYYKGGDTFAYFDNVRNLWEIFSVDFPLGLKILLSDILAVDLDVYAPTKQLRFYHDPRTFMVVRITTVLSFISFKSFWLTSIVLSAFSFSGLWAMYRVFIDYFPKLYVPLAVAIFFIPSVFFWSAGISKDAITLSGLGWLVYASYHLFIKQDKIVFALFMFAINFYLVKVIKPYIVIAFLPAMLYWVTAYYFGKVKDIALKAFMWMLLLSGFVVGTYILRNNIQTVVYYGIQTFVDMASDFHSYHGHLADTRGQSGYSLGEISFTPMGIVSKIPASVNVTLFRPYLFEVRNPVMLISAVESTIMLFLTIAIILRVGFFRVLGILKRYPIIMFCLLYAVIFGFAVGFTSYNFGALVRYKIPCIPFYVSALFMVYHLYELEKRGIRLSIWQRWRTRKFRIID